MGGVGNHFGLNTHENGVAWGTNAVNQLSHGVASGQGATVTRGNLTREQYQEGVRQYQSLLDEKNQLTAQKAQLEGNKELKAGEISALNNRINEINNKITEHGNTLGRINSLNQQKQTMVEFVNNINSQITAKEGEYNLSDKTRIYEFEDFYKTLNKLDWTQYGNGAGADNLANQLKARVSEFNPNIANKYSQDKYKEIINAYVNLNSVDKQPTVNWFNARLHSFNGERLGDNFTRNNVLSISGSNYKFFDIKYKFKGNNHDDSYSSGLYDSDYGYGNSLFNETAKNTDIFWRYEDKSISNQYLEELEWMYNNLDNTTNYSLYVTRNTLRRVLNNKSESENLILDNDTGSWSYGVDYLNTLYANFGNVNLVYSLSKAIGATWSARSLNEINNDNINEANKLSNNFIHDYEGVDLNATAKNVTSIEETRNLFKPFYDKMIQLRDITNLYKEINSGTLDESTKRQKQAVYLQKLADYRNALNAEIDHYDTLEGYISHFVRPHVRYSDEFVNHFKTATREYIDFLKANRHKLLSYDPNDEFIKEISDKAKSLIQDLKNLNDQKSAKEKEIEGISNQIKNLTDNLGADEQALNQQKQEKQAELEKVQKEKEQLDAQVAEKEKELARKQAEVLEKLKQQSGEGNAVAIGDNSFASGVSAVALGVGSESIGDHALALGTQAKATKSDSIAIGHGTEVTGEQSIAIGKGHRISGSRSTTIGDPNTITGDDSVAVGNNNTINSNHVMVLGNNVTVGENLHHSVVLGSNSTVLAPVATTSYTIAGTQYNFAGTAPVATVSIGAEGKERTLTNLAAGRISSTSTDAINGSQLNAVIESLNSLKSTPTVSSSASSGIMSSNFGNFPGANTHERGVALGLDSINAVSNGVAIGVGAVTAYDNMSREDYNKITEGNNIPNVISPKEENGHSLPPVVENPIIPYPNNPKDSEKPSVSNPEVTVPTDPNILYVPGKPVGDVEVTTAPVISTVLTGRENSHDPVAVTAEGVSKPSVTRYTPTISDSSLGAPMSVGVVSPTHAVHATSRANVNPLLEPAPFNPTTTDNPHPHDELTPFRHSDGVEPINKEIATLRAEFTTLYEYFKANPTKPAEGDEHYAEWNTKYNRIKEIEKKINQLIAKDKQRGNEIANLRSMALPPKAGNAIAIGDSSFSSGVSSIAIGYNSTATNYGAVAIGRDAQATHEKSVVLGSGSMSTEKVGVTGIDIAGQHYAFAGSAPISTVSIGKPNEERQLTNLAAGRISNTSTDGINGSQLNAVIETLNSLNTELTTLKNTPKAKAPVIKAGDGLSLTEGDDGSITLSNALTFNTGNGVSVNKEGNNITITNTQPLSAEDKTKYDTASTNANNALEKANTNEGAISTANDKITDLSGKVTTVTNTANEALGKANTAVQPDALEAGTGIRLDKADGKITITNTQPLSVEDKAKYDTASTNASNALEKANTNEGAINTANGKINDLTSRVTANEGNITTLTGKVTTVTNTANEALGKANTAVQPDKLKAGNGISVSKADNGEITITNTHPLSDENKTKYDNASAKAETALQPESLVAGNGVTVNNAGGKVTIANTGVIEIQAGDGVGVQNNNGVVTVSNTKPDLSFEGKDGITVDKQGNNVVISATGLAPKGTGVNNVEGANGISVTKEGDKFIITNTSPFEDTDKETLNTASGKANTAVQPDKLKAGNGISIDKAENGDITVTNTKPFEDVDKEKLNNASTTATSALEKANTNEGAINTANGKITANEGKITIQEGKVNDLTSRVTANEGNITTLTGNVTAVTNTANEALGKANTNAETINNVSGVANEALGKANTAVQPDKLKAGNGISVSKADNGDITIENTKAFENADKEKLNTAFDKSNTAVQPNDLTAGKGITINKGQDGINISTNITGGKGISVVESNNGLTINNLMEIKAGKGVKIDNDGNTYTISSTGTALPRFEIRGDDKVVHEVVGTLNVAGDENIETTTEGGKVTVKLKKDIDVNSVKSGDNIFGKGGLKVGNTLITAKGAYMGNQVVDGVADGEIAPNSKQAINGGQLAPVVERILDHERAITQLDGKVNYLDQRITRMDKKHNAGIAGVAAMVGIPQVMEAGGVVFGAGVGNHAGANAVAVGASMASDNGRHMIKTSFSVNSQKQVTSSIGYGFKWK